MREPAELDDVVALYDAYDAAGGAPSDLLKGAHLNAALRATIHDGFELTQQNRRLAAIRADLMQHVEQCPICSISPPRVLDHHLPKGTFSPLAIYVRNLIPLCFDCNLFKGATASANPAEMFVHPYFQAFPDVPFLHAALMIEDEALVVEFRVAPDAELPSLLRTRLDYQLRRLHINERYSKEVNSYLTGHTTALHMCFGALGADGVQQFLIRQAEIEFVRFHRNHWRPVLLAALASHAEFCQGAFIRLLPPVPSSTTSVP